MNKLMSKYNALKNRAKSNKGFTLVELIVVIVILAILIGVSVNGYTKYIGQSRINTDKQNVATIKSVAVNATAEAGVYEEFTGKADGTKTLTITLSGKDNPKVESDTFTTYAAAVTKALAGSTTKLQYQPADKSTPSVVITITPDSAGDVTVKVVATNYPDDTFDGQTKAG